MFVSLSKTRLLLLPCLIAASLGPVAAHAQNPLPQTPPQPQTPRRTPRSPRTPTPNPNPTPDPQNPDPQNPTPAPAPGPNPQIPGGGGGGFGGRFGGGGGGQQARPAAPRPYKDVITAEAKSDPGLFTVHRIDDRILFEIPANQIGKEMLLAAEIEKAPAGTAGYGGTAAGNHVIRFTRRNNVVYLRTVDYSSRAEGKGAIARAIEAANVEPIVMAFNVEAEGEGKSAVIDVTRLFNSDPAEFAVKQRVGGSAVDPTRTFIEKTKSFPTNIEVKSNMTFIGGGGAGAGLGQLPGAPTGRRRGGGGGASSLTALVHYSLVLLPEKPLMPRLYDSRVGYFTESFEDYGAPENRVVDKQYIARYRLEKKDPKAALSEPVKPIVYYISREVPEEWHPYLKKAVESWNVAFEQAGFKNAIVCKEPPTFKEDPDWDPEDARYSVIRWAPTTTENAQGPHISDPRTGEILSAHIIVWHNILKLGETWYFTQVGDMDKRAQKLPLPQELMGDIMQYVVCHEVGHTLGLRHNHKASSSYTAAQLRDKTFTDQYGDEASIMDYGRFNYVAQPGDNARLIPIIGPYDKFAIEWGYKPMGMNRPDDEKPELDKLASQQVSNPMLRFGGEDLNAQSDPTVETEDLGNDPVEATSYGLKNISKIARMLVPATTKYGEDYETLGEMYTALWAQRQRELGHVAKVVGGVVQTDYHAGRGGEVYSPVPPAKQAQAVKFLVDNAFTTPRDLLLTDILNRIQASGVQDEVLNGQRSILTSLLSDVRVKRMLDIQATSTGTSYTVGNLVRDLQNGIWSELYKPTPVVDLYRRNLQRAYLETMRSKLQGDSATPTDLRPIATGSLMDLQRVIDRALVKTTDADTRLHLMDSRNTIERILKAPVVVTQPAAAPAAFPFGRGGIEDSGK